MNLTIIIFGIGAFIVLSISGAFSMAKEKRLKNIANNRGYEYGIYYELLNGEDAFCFIHIELYQAEKCLNQLMKNTDFTQVTDWEGRVYSFKNESFEKAIGEKIDRQKFKIIRRSLKFNDNKNSPKLWLERTSSPRLTQ